MPFFVRVILLAAVILLLILGEDGMSLICNNITSRVIDYQQFEVIQLVKKFRKEN